MNRLGIALDQGFVEYDFLLDMVRKLRFSLINLCIVIGIYYSLGLFDPFLRLSYYLAGGYVVFTLVRLLDTYRISHHKKSESLCQHWKIIKYGSLLSNLYLAIINAVVIYYNELNPYSFYVALSVIGTLVGGTQQYFFDKKLYNWFAVACSALPIASLGFKGNTGIVLAAILGYFVFFLRANVMMQNRFYWKSRKENDFSTTILNSIPSPLAIFDEDLSLIQVNESVAKLIEKPVEDIIGKNLKDFIRKESNHEFFRFIESFRNLRAISIQEQEVSLNLSGEHRFYFMVLTKIKNTQNNLLIGLDLTQLREAQTELESQKAINLEAAKLSSIGEMANSMAHEINNPLAVILGKTEQAQRVLEMPEPKLEYLEKSLTVISTNVKRISTIIHGLRTLSGGLDDEFFDAALTDVVDKVKLLSQEKILSSGVQIRFGEFPATRFFGNPAQISQVLLHLIHNAHEAVLAQETPWIEVSYRDQGELIEILVTDSGAGIPIEIAEKMFNPFYTTKDIGKGMGLGLSVSKGIVESHRGQFFVDNACENTRFVVRLPKLLAAAA